ncbi:DUF6660 family protein [Filimonas effusa]|uniref:Uncharacterized protein n=1 Tax=Filimonas effusa TaxID=2508721 RepID=A0A4Q1CYU7_9BACT|nr:DUF6660 family protein [Filimonas effusa]RXK80436.1 hypothetical protein ESB13_23605 [Filimonas effusa]
MKWLVFLFSLYVLVLSGIPCSADDDCCIEESRSLTSSQHEKSSDSDHKPMSPCSPFFACGACHGITLPVLTVICAPEYVPVLVEKTSFYQEYIKFDFHSNIWQPPKRA